MFPTDEQTLGMLEWALDTRATGQSSLHSFLALQSQLAGADVRAVESEDLGVTVLRDPQYSPDDVMLALIAALRASRNALATRGSENVNVQD